MQRISNKKMNKTKNEFFFKIKVYRMYALAFKAAMPSKYELKSDMMQVQLPVNYYLFFI